MNATTRMVCAGFCVFVLTSGSQWAIGHEEEDPNIAQLLASFEPSWDSVTLSVTGHNPQGPEDDKTQYALQVVTEVTPPESTQLLGTDTSAGRAEATDELGNNYVQPGRPFTRFYRRPSYHPFTGELRPLGHAMRFSLDPDQGYPTLLETLNWSIAALFAKQFDEVEIPFEPSDTWTELAPGIEVRFEEAKTGETGYSYRLKTRFEGVNPFHFFGSISTFRGLPEVLITDMQLLDDTGHAVNRPPSGGGGRTAESHTDDASEDNVVRLASDHLTTGTVSGVGGCRQCGEVKTARFTLAEELIEETIELSLTDIPVPTF